MKTIKTKPIFDIFSKRERTINLKNEPEEKPKIFADYREKNSLVPSELVSLGIEVEFKELKVADFIVRNVAVERKTISDFISSMINKRLLKQLEELQQYEKKLLIIEGIDEQELYSDDENKSMRFHRRHLETAVPQFEEIQKTSKVSSFEVPENFSFSEKPAGSFLHPNAIRGFLLSILLRHNIPILFTKDYKDTAKFLSLIAKKEAHEMSTRAVKKSRNKKEQMQYILEGFPGIGPKTAKKLLEQFKSIKNIINAPEEELKDILGKKAEIFFKIIEENY